MDEVMPRRHTNLKKPANTHRADHAGKAPHPQLHISAPASQYEALGDEPLAVASRLTLEEPFRIDRGLVQRLRRREVNAKEAFTIRDASGAYFRVSLKEWDDHGGMALPYERMDRSPEPTIDITLACAVLARQRMHFVVQKATELGVRRIVPLLTDHAVPLEGLAQEQAHAWPGHIARAARQCRRASLPGLLSPMPLDSFLASTVFTAADRCLFLDDRSEGAAPGAGLPQRIVLLVGPEGGFSDAERAKLAGKAWPWVLGGRILRAETAVVAGLAAVQLKWGDFAHEPQDAGPC
jgi:16S rRNA (uracil1498-N3)-methyltransferase